MRGSQTVLSRNNKARTGPTPQAADGSSPGRPAEPVVALPSSASSSRAPGPLMTRRALKNWRVRSRLLLLITIPTLAALVLGGIRIVSSVQSALAYQRVEQLANLSSAVTNLAYNLEGESAATIEFIGQSASQGGRAAYVSALSAHKSAPPTVGPNLKLVSESQGLATQWIAPVRHGLASIGAGYPTQVQDEVQNINALLNDLPTLRAVATQTSLPALVVLDKYTNLVDQLIAIDDNIALGASDQLLATDVRALGLISRISEETSQQSALLVYALEAGNFGPGVLSGLTAAQADANANIQQFQVEATPAQLAAYKAAQEAPGSASQVDLAAIYENEVIQFGSPGESLSAVPLTVDEVEGAFNIGPIQANGAVESGLVSQTISRASSLRRGAILTAAIVGAAVLLLLLFALLLTTVVGRSMVRPLRRLRAGALEVAGVRLPETVRRMSDSDGAGMPLDVEPIDVDSSDEIGEVARAFDQVHREALRLASNEAALRGNVNAMFVNLSRRSQSLVERQIRLIDDLEQGEQDPDRLASLFQMDHLATRMRRNSENLLVLAGHEATRRWNQPVALVDVLRAAVSEIEQYERVTLNVQPGIAVRGHAVNDVVHLLAELAENATSFSSAETPVVVSGHLLSSGGVLLDISDQGVGMGAEEMAHANWRLDNPPVVDVAVSRRMGLFVVARLAARHGIRVRLRPAPAGGLTALVWLPDEVVSHESDTGGTGSRRFEAASAASNPMVVVPGTVEDEISPAEQEILAARAPKFASLQAESETNGKLGPRRIPGAGPRPGQQNWGSPATTSPLPAIGSVPQPASGEDDDAISELGVDAEPAAMPAGLASGATEPVLATFGQTDFGTSPVGAVDLSGPTVQFSQEPAAPAEVAAPVGAAAGLSDLGSAPRGVLDHDDVVIPAAEHVATQNRLPIFEAVESDWFRRGRTGLGGWAGPQAPDALVGVGTITTTAESAEVAWSTPSDEGWEAAAAIASPTTGGTTSAGLPKRVPQANLVPGAASQEVAAPVPARSASATRERFTSFQRGSREGRVAAGTADNESDQEDSS
jgi:signal transduction histidine kinase